MGRKTYESISKPLSNRTNIVITNGGYYIPSEHFGKIAYTKSLKAAIDYVTERDGVAFIIGGARIYQTAFYLGVVDRIYLTIIKNVHKCDVYFPQIPDNFKVVDSQDFKDRINLILEA
jgi:dihydrofolate reductase